VTEVQKSFGALESNTDASLNKEINSAAGAAWSDFWTLGVRIPDTFSYLL